MKRARHKKEKQIEAQATSAEQLHHETEDGDGAQPVVVEEHAPPDSREGEKRFSPEMTIYDSLNAKILFDPELVSLVTNLEFRTIN